MLNFKKLLRQKPIIYLPEDVVKATDAKVGDEIDVNFEGKNHIIIEKQ